MLDEDSDNGFCPKAATSILRDAAFPTSLTLANQLTNISPIITLQLLLGRPPLARTSALPLMRSLSFTPIPLTLHLS